MFNISTYMKFVGEVIKSNVEICGDSIKINPVIMRTKL